VDPYTGPRDVPGDDDGQPLLGPYDPGDLPAPPPSVDGPRCHTPGCGLPRSYRHGVLVCRICDAPPITKE